MQNSLERLRQVDLWRYDAVVMSIGTNNSLLLTSPAAWARHLSEIVDYLEEETATGTGIYLVAIPPISSIDVSGGVMGRLAERHAHRLNAETRRIAARSPSATFVPFSPLVKADFTRYRSAATYQQWASVIAAPLIRDLRRSDGAIPTVAPHDELARQHALDAIGIVGTGAEERFDRIARLATQLFGADHTVIVFLDHDRLWVKSASNGSMLANADPQRAGSFSDWVAREPAPFVVEDASVDPRFAQHPSVVNDEAHVRFFAGYPIESAFGERVGVLGVFAREPRSWSESETKLLRDLALMVQRELTLD